MTRLSNLRLAAAAAGIVLPLAFPAAAQDIRMAIWSANEGHLALFNEIAAAYKAIKPDVNVTFDSLPFDGYTTTLTRAPWRYGRRTARSTPIRSPPRRSASSSTTT